MVVVCVCSRYLLLCWVRALQLAWLQMRARGMACQGLVGRVHCWGVGLGYVWVRRRVVVARGAARCDALPCAGVMLVCHAGVVVWLGTGVVC